jgi:hypothetical protein
LPEQVRELRDEWLQAGGEFLDERYSVRDAAHTVERVTEDVCVDTGLRLRGGIDGFDVFAQRQDIAKALGLAGQLLQAKVFDKHEIETRVRDDVASERDRLRGAELAVELLHGRLGAGICGDAPQNDAQRPAAEILQQAARHPGRLVLADRAAIVGGEFLHQGQFEVIEHRADQRLHPDPMAARVVDQGDADVLSELERIEALPFLRTRLGHA